MWLAHGQRYATVVSAPSYRGLGSELVLARMAGFGQKRTSADMTSRDWILYSPVAPLEESAPQVGQPLTMDGDPIVQNGFHANGHLLPEAQFEGWEFGVMQDRLVPSGLVAFVRTPSGDEASLLWTSHTTSFERVETIKREAGYIGAFSVYLGPARIESREALVEQFKALLPSLKAAFAADGR